MTIPIPGLKKSVGAGDVIKAGLAAVGVKPGKCRCAQRRAALNRALTIKPREKK